MRKGPVTLLVWWGESWLTRDMAEPCAIQHPERGMDGHLKWCLAREQRRGGCVGESHGCNSLRAGSQPCCQRCSASRTTPQVPLSLLLPVQQWGCGAVSPSMAGPPPLQRAGEEAPAPGLLARTTRLSSHTGAMWPAMSPFACSWPQCSPIPPSSASTLPPRHGTTISWAQLGCYCSQIPNQSQTWRNISALFGTSALPCRGPGTARTDRDTGLPSPGIRSPGLAYWRRTSSWQGNTLLSSLLLLLLFSSS